MGTEQVVHRLEPKGPAGLRPKGTVCRWKTSGSVGKLYSILDPTAG